MAIWPVASVGIEEETAEFDAVFLSDFVRLDPLHDGHGAVGSAIGLAGAGGAVEYLVEPVAGGGCGAVWRWQQIHGRRVGGGLGEGLVGASASSRKTDHRHVGDQGRLLLVHPQHVYPAVPM